MTLVYTSNDGAAQSQLELSTPSQNVARPVLQELASALTYPAPGGGLLRVPVGGGAPAPLLGSASGQLAFWDAVAGQWVVSDTPAAGNVPVWSAALNKWVMTPLLAPVQTQIGYAGGNSNVLTLQPGGHAPGLYAVSFVGVIRTAAASGTTACRVTWSSPTFGAELKNLQNLSSTIVGSNWLINTGTTAGARTLGIQSDGVDPITAFFSGALTGTPLIDLYACAQRVGA